MTQASAAAAEARRLQANGRQGLCRATLTVA
jgi:hypothetical protein